MAHLFEIPSQQRVDPEVLSMIRRVQWKRRESEQRFAEARRASNFPVCPRAFHIYRRLPPDKRPFEEESFISEAATLMGTALHTVLQKWLGIEAELYGNWVCLDCKRIKRHKYGIQTCSKCGREMWYKEYAVNPSKKYPFSGHLDGLLRTSNYRYLLDFKGSSQEKIKARVHEGLPEEKHYYQTNAYAHMVNMRQKRFGNFGKVDGILVIYVDRGTPWKLIHCVQMPLSKRVFKQTVGLIHDAIESVNEMNLPTGICASRSDKNATYCRVKDLCFSKVCEAKLHDKVWPEAKQSNSSKVLERAMIEI
jgi:hypothetical protein